MTTIESKFILSYLRVRKGYPDHTSKCLPNVTDFFSHLCSHSVLMLYEFNIVQKNEYVLAYFSLLPNFSADCHIKLK